MGFLEDARRAADEAARTERHKRFPLDGAVLGRGLGVTLVADCTGLGYTAAMPIVDSTLNGTATPEEGLEAAATLLARTCRALYVDDGGRDQEPLGAWLLGKLADEPEERERVSTIIDERPGPLRFDDRLERILGLSGADGVRDAKSLVRYVVNGPADAESRDGYALSRIGYELAVWIMRGSDESARRTGE